MNKLLLLFLCAFAVFMSCKKEPTATTIAERELCALDSSLLKTVTSTGADGKQQVANYHYDSFNRLEEIESGQMPFHRRISYTGDTIQVSIDPDSTGTSAVIKYVVAQNGTTLYKQDRIIPGNGIVLANKYYHSYNTSGQLTQYLRRFYNETLPPHDTTTADSITYVWQDGNMVSSVLRGSAQSGSVVTYTYLPASMGRYWINTPFEVSLMLLHNRLYHPVISKNLVSEISYLTAAGALYKKIAYTYEFDSYGRITKRIVKTTNISPAGPDLIVTVQYRYKCI